MEEKANGGGVVSLVAFTGEEVCRGDGKLCWVKIYLF